MRRREMFSSLAAGAFLSAGLQNAEGRSWLSGTGAGGATPAAGETVACRVVESHTSERDGITVVIFHQRNKADGARLGEMIRALDGKSVRFEKADAKPHSATLFRLQSCFGRGLLLFPASSARLEAGDDFALQVPPR